ncbi:MAG: carbon storage regulator [Planctomycetota bacterium]|nr:carbon storage regulator [Planctomycetota bacterium]MDA1179730.1 carbon storage regulator [Planctomycetota bacterium]
MLILTRKLGEQIMIGENTTISIVGISGGRVRVGIKAPRDKSIRRLEISLLEIEGEPETGEAPVTGSKKGTFGCLN